jgi:predicted DNA-binding protein
MASVMVRVDAKLREALRKITRETGKPAGLILQEAVEDYCHKEFFCGLSEDFARLKKDKKGWKEELGERRAWDATLLDGLDR